MCDKRKKSSFVWEHFDLCEDGDKVTCRICKVTLSYGQSTSSMVKHLQAKHPYAVMEKQTKPRYRPYLVQLIYVSGLILGTEQG